VAAAGQIAMATDITRGRHRAAGLDPELGEPSAQRNDLVVVVVPDRLHQWVSRRTMSVSPLVGLGRVEQVL